MKITIIEEKKNRLVFEIEGATHTFCNIIKEGMQNDDNVKIATYLIKHPSANAPRFIVETDGSDPRKAVIDATQKIKKLAEKVGNDFASEIK